MKKQIQDLTFENIVQIFEVGFPERKLRFDEFYIGENFAGIPSITLLLDRFSGGTFSVSLLHPKVLLWLYEQGYDITAFLQFQANNLHTKRRGEYSLQVMS